MQIIDLNLFYRFKLKKNEFLLNFLAFTPYRNKNRENEFTFTSFSLSLFIFNLFCSQK